VNRILTLNKYHGFSMLSGRIKNGDFVYIIEDRTPYLNMEGDIGPI